MPLTFLPYTSLNEVLIRGGIPFLSDKMAEGISHHRVSYLNEYLEKLGTKTAIVEHEYIDRNFMDDYCGYYAKCFNKYPKKCERIHLFKCAFDENILRKAALDSDAYERKLVVENYLGFIVIRPIPGAHFGKVCLATYPAEESKVRCFPVLKKYYAHLLGLSLCVESVAFQEQDNVVSACATSALWSAFHAIKSVNPEDVHSPFRITQNARRVILESPSFNVMEKGLDSSQMSAAIADEGFDSLLSGFRSKSYLKAVTRAYLNVGLPLVLGMTLAYEDEKKHTGAGHSAKIGEHAVSVVGYRIGAVAPLPYYSGMAGDVGAIVPELRFVSSCIDKFYVHDDQVGPFSSMEDRHEYWQRLETRWNYYVDKDDKVDATVNTVIIPCFNKIRIRFPLIFNLVNRCNLLFGRIWQNSDKSLVWDARLFSVTDLKKRVADRALYGETDDSIRFKLLSKKLPRYLWVVDVYEAVCENNPDMTGDNKFSPDLLATYIFDATDMASSDYFLLGIHHDRLSYALFRKFLNSINEEIPSFLKMQSLNRIVLGALLESYIDDSDRLILLDDATKSF
jgi:hypothetical protein